MSLHAIRDLELTNQMTEIVTTIVYVNLVDPLYLFSLQISSLQSAYDSFHHDNPGVGYFLVSEGEGKEGGAISLHHLKDFCILHAKGGKVH